VGKKKEVKCQKIKVTMNVNSLTLNKREKMYKDDAEQSFSGIKTKFWLAACAEA
jgi:hypothetical protein